MPTRLPRFLKDLFNTIWALASTPEGRAALVAIKEALDSLKESRKAKPDAVLALRIGLDANGAAQHQRSVVFDPTTKPVA